jgi:OHCU decarboxylase
MMTLESLSSLNQEKFVAALNGVFEHSPWIAEKTWASRPFSTLASLHAALMATLNSAPLEKQLTVVRAHPELAGKAAMRGELTAESTREQAGARLDACTPEEFHCLQELNAAYREKFGFPFIIAVRNLDRTQIIARFSERLNNTPSVEFGESLRQIETITALRLADLIAS